MSDENEHEPCEEIGPDWDETVKAWAGSPTGRTDTGPVPPHIHALGSEARGAWETASTEDILADLNVLAKVATERAREAWPADQRITWRAVPRQGPEGWHEVWEGRVAGELRFLITTRKCEGRPEPLAKLHTTETPKIKERSFGPFLVHQTDQAVAFGWPVGEFLHLEGAKNRARRVLRLGVEAAIVRAPS